MAATSAFFVCPFIPFLKQREQTRGTPFPERDLLAIEPADIGGSADEAAGRILQIVSSEPMRAAREALSFANRFNDHRGFIRSAKRLIYAKGGEAHRYKFAAAVELSSELFGRLLSKAFDDCSWLDIASVPQ